MKPAPKYIQEILIREFNIHFPIYNHRQNLDGSTFPEILFNIAADHLISPVKVFQEFKAWMDKHAANFNLQSLLTYNDVFPRFFSDNPSEKWCYNCKKIYPIDGFRRKSEQKVKSRHCCNTCFIQELIK